MPGKDQTILYMGAAAGALGAWYLEQGNMIFGLTIPEFFLGSSARYDQNLAASQAAAAAAGSLTASPTTAASGNTYTLPTPMSATQIATAAKTTLSALDSANSTAAYGYFRKFPNRTVKAGTIIHLPRGANLARLRASAESLAALMSGRVS